MASLPPSLRTRRARVLIALGVAVVALRIALPYALEAGIAWAGPRAAGVAISVDDIDLELLRGRVVVDGLAVAGPGHPTAPEGAIDLETALFRWDRLDLNLEWIELVKGRLRLSELALAAPAARVELDESGEPILPEPPADPEADSAADTTAEPEPESAPEAPTEAGSGWPILVDRLEVTGLDVRLLDGDETPAVEAGLEALRLADVRFDDAGLGLGAIGFEAPSLRVRRDFVFGEPAAEAETEPASEEPAPAEGEAAIYRMEELRIERAEFVMLTQAGPMQMAIEMNATGVTTEPGVRFPFEIHLDVGDGSLEVAGEVGAVPPAFRGEVRWSDLPLPPITMLARPDLAGWVASHRASGRLDVDLRLEPEGEQPAGLTLRGEATSHDLLFRDPESEDFALGWKRFAIPIDEVSVPLGEGAEAKPVRVALGAIRLEAPHATYRTPTGALDRLFPPAEDGEAPPAEASEAPADAGPEPIVTVASFDLVDGELGYHDGSLRPAYAGRVRRLAVSLRDVRLPAQTVANLSLSARLPVRSNVSLKGSHGARRSKLRFDLERLALPPLNPYAAPAAGYRIEDGHVSLETTAERAGERWDVSNQLVLGDLDLASTGTGKLDKLIGIPVDLAIALLRDLEGKISLGIPVAFDRGGLKIGIGSVLRDALRAAVAGAVTSPLKMMGAAVSFGEGGGLAVEPLAMQPGRSDLVGDDADGRLLALAELLETRPALAVRLHGGASPEDRDGLAERILIERLAADEGLPEIEDSGFFARRRVRRALEARGRGEEGALESEDEALLARYRTAADVPPARFSALARERAEAVASLLIEEHTLSPEHVRVAEATDAEQPAVRITFEAR